MSFGAELQSRLKKMDSTLDDNGLLKENCNPLAKQLQVSIYLYKHISGFEDLFEEWERQKWSWKALFQD